MKTRLLIINAPSPYFLYIPMGSFGLCDFLGKHNIQAGIFNPALYPYSQLPAKLHAHITDYQPTHVAVVCHWQETIHGLLEILSLVRKQAPSLPILAGGFTASYFGASLMRHCPDLDFVIHGDPEQPLLDLLSGETPADQTANLVYRSGDDIIRSKSTWLMDEITLDRLSFSNLSCLHDRQSYIEKTRSILGFPLFIGRGCVFNCAYCGGGRTAFQHHSSRSKPIQRSLEAILRDLHILKQYTDTLYICYENDQQYLVALFQAVAQDPGLRQHFTLNYGAWHPIDDTFLDAYLQAFRIDVGKPIFEFSPEVISDQSRRTIKGNLASTLDQTLESAATIHKRLHGHAKIELFFSRYHPTEMSFPLLWSEIEQIYLLKHRMFAEHLFSVHIRYDHLSTDIASDYWHTVIQGKKGFSWFLETKQAIDDQRLYPFPVDNLCLYIPEDIPRDHLTILEGVIEVLEEMEQRTGELFHVLFAALSPSWPAALKNIVADLIRKDGEDFFQSLPMALLIQRLEKALETAYRPEHKQYFPDLFRYTLQKLACEKEKTTIAHQPMGTDSYILDHRRVSTHAFNYADITGFVNRIYNEQGQFAGYERTVCFFLKDRIISIPHKTYRLTLQSFEKQQVKAAYMSHLRGIPGLDPRPHEELLEILIEQGVLLPCSG